MINFIFSSRKLKNGFYNTGKWVLYGGFTETIAEVLFTAIFVDLAESEQVFELLVR
jgi:hypothetical protein